MDWKNLSTEARVLFYLLAAADLPKEKLFFINDKQYYLEQAFLQAQAIIAKGVEVK